MTLWTWDGCARTWRPMVLPTDRPSPVSPSATLVPLGGGRCGVLAGGRMWVNGEPALPLRVLDDRDELRLPDGAVHYVSVDDDTSAVPFPAGAEPIRCARCGSAIEAGESCVQCPRCRVTCHQTSHLPCWTHADACPACGQSSVGPSWEPEPLEMPRDDGQMEVDVV